jgi:hypothetical protein
VGNPAPGGERFRERMRYDRFSYAKRGNVSPLFSRIGIREISGGISIRVWNRFEDVKAARVSKHAARERTAANHEESLRFTI